MTLFPCAEAYLIHLLTHQKQPLLGHYQMGKLCLSNYGTIVADEWVRSAANRKGIELDQWAVTPDSIHGIVFLPALSSTRSESVTCHTLTGQKPWLLSSFIASFKAAATKRINLRRNQLGQPVWQRNYHEQIISGSLMLAQLRQHLQEIAG